MGLLQPLLYWAAYLWRRLLFRTTFIAVTGSLGKTTAKECLAAILASSDSTFRSYRNQNSPASVVLNLLRIRPWHRFAVLEVASAAPGSMRRSARLVTPDVAIVLPVLRTHTSTFGSLKEHAAEKRVLLDYLRPGGSALLFADDPQVRDMAAGLPRRVVLFGTMPGCDIRAEEVSSPWPRRLAFTVRSDVSVQAVTTRLAGVHWLPSALAALAAANLLGMDLTRAAEALSKVDPFTARHQPVRVPSGAVVLRDDYSASIDTVEPSLRILREASADRRLLAITDMSDFGVNRRQRLKRLAAAAPGAAEVLVIVGEEAEYGRRRAIDAGLPEGNVHAFAAIREAAGFLRQELRPGDLMLLKGRTTDHAARILFAQVGPVGCWKEFCPKRMPCDICWELDITPEQHRLLSVVPPPEYDGGTTPGGDGA